MIICTPTTFKRKKKTSQIARANRAETDALNKRWGVDPKVKLKSTQPLKPYLPVIDDVSSKIPSLDTGSGDTAKKPSPVYTGDAVIGISTMHKSNSVPVFSQQEAIDTATMRR